MQRKCVFIGLLEDEMVCTISNTYSAETFISIGFSIS